MSIQTQVNPVTFMASNNGQRVTKSWTDKLQGALLTIATTAIIGNFTFLWKLNAWMTRLEDHDIQKTNSINDLNSKMNNMQLDVQDIKIRTIKIESQQPKK